MMDIKDILANLRESEEFNNWKDENKDVYLAHVFLMDDEANKNAWQVGFYDKEKDHVTTFVNENDCIKTIPDQEVFKKPNMKIKELKENDVEISLDEAIKKADILQHEKYSAHIPLKKIVILQNIDKGQVFNITFVTRTFNTLNIKIDSKTGEILEHNLTSIIQTMEGKEEKT